MTFPSSVPLIDTMIGLPHGAMKKTYAVVSSL